MLTVARWVLESVGVVLVGVGVYFVGFRPPLLPEDARFVGVPAVQLLAVAPGLGRWLRRVFTVLGGHLTANGISSCTSRTPGCPPAADSPP